jgi:hypothetical protein
MYYHFFHRFWWKFIHGSRGGSFMLTVLACLTLWKTKNKVLLSWFGGTVYTGTQQNRSDKMCHLQAPASQALLASWLRLTLAASAKLVGYGNDEFYLIGSAVLQCMEYQWTTAIRQKTVYFYFYFYQSVSRANTVKTNASPLNDTYIIRILCSRPVSFPHISELFYFDEAGYMAHCISTYN